MLLNFGIAFKEMGIGKLEIIVIGSVLLIFPVLFVIASKNLEIIDFLV